MSRRVRHLASLAVLLGLAVAASTAGPRAQPLDGAQEALPDRLAATGLYLDGSTTVKPGNLAFSPQYPLWSDGAQKRRWLSLPPGAFIDARRPDAWEFPRGTRLWKEFSFGGRKVETRFIERLADGSWRFAAYVWNEQGTEAVLAPARGIAAHAVAQAPGGRYAIPSQSDCRACHEGGAVPVLGVSALQLSPDRDPLAVHAEAGTPDKIDLRGLVARGWLRNLPQRLLDEPPRIVAASPTERAALGYLHGNCGHCHNDAGDEGGAPPVELVLAQGAGGAARAERALASMLGGSSRFRTAGAPHAVRAVTAGAADSSVLALRMRSRNPYTQMPPLGTRLVDTEALVLIERWITTDLQTRKENAP